jgi:hypothetical protein
MKIILTFVPPLNSFILNEAECEGLPEGAQVTVKTRCQGAGIAPTGIIIAIPGRGDLDAMAALLDEANLKIEVYEEQIGELGAASAELVAELEELNKKLGPAFADTTTKPYESETPADPPANVPAPEGEGTMFEGQPASPYLNTAADPYEPEAPKKAGKK